MKSNVYGCWDSAIGLQPHSKRDNVLLSLDPVLALERCPKQHPQRRFAVKHYLSLVVHERFLLAAAGWPELFELNEYNFVFNNNK